MKLAIETEIFEKKLPFRSAVGHVTRIPFIFFLVVTLNTQPLNQFPCVYICLIRAGGKGGQEG